MSKEPELSLQDHGESPLKQPKQVTRVTTAAQMINADKSPNKAISDLGPPVGHLNVQIESMST